MADADKEKAPETPKPASGGSKILPLLLGVNSLMVVGVLAVLVLRPSGSGGAGHPAPGAAEHEQVVLADGGKADSAVPGPTYRLPDFIIHLRNSEADRYARLSFEVEVATEEDKTRLTNRLPHIRDDFISFLSDRTIEELRGSQAIGRTKQALTERLAEVAPDVKIRALYVTDLVIQ